MSVESGPLIRRDQGQAHHAIPSGNRALYTITFGDTHPPTTGSTPLVITVSKTYTR